MQEQERVIAIYSRKSKFTGKGESVGNQIELCKEYIQSHYGQGQLEKAVVFEDEGFSGGNLNRPDFKKMLKEARKGTIKAIIVYRLDRISRNISDFSGLIQELSDLNIAFVSIKEQFDTSNPMGRAMMYIASVFSQLERETIAERIRDNMQELAKTGRWLGGTTPTGYASECIEAMEVDGKIKKSYQLKLIPQEEMIVRRIFDLFLQTDSLTMTEAALMQQEIKSKKGNYYTRFAIKSILQNPVYIAADQDALRYFQEKQAELCSEPKMFDGIHGMMVYNRTLQQKGKTTRLRPVSQWIVAVGGHLGIVSGKEWVAVQLALEKNKEKSYHKARVNHALLTGVLYCSCGSRMYPKLSQSSGNSQGQRYTYLCKMKERSRKNKCSQRNLKGDIADAAVLEQIKQLKEDKRCLIQQLGKKSFFYDAAEQENAIKRNEIYQQKNKIQKEIQQWIDIFVEAESQEQKDNALKQLEGLKMQDKQMNRQACSLQQANIDCLSQGELNQLKEKMLCFACAVDQMTIEQKRAMLSTIISKVVWNGKEIELTLAGTEESPCIHRSSAAIPLLGEDSK